jgi:hypothetical protein
VSYEVLIELLSASLGVVASVVVLVGGVNRGREKSEKNNQSKPVQTAVQA